MSDEAERELLSKLSLVRLTDFLIGSPEEVGKIRLKSSRSFLSVTRTTGVVYYDQTLNFHKGTVSSKALTI